MIKEKKPNNELTQIIDNLEQGVTDLFESERYQKYLRTMAQFHNYSANNVLLILQQNPDATCIAGYNAWQKKFERHVRPGEKAIEILAPVDYQKTIKRIKYYPNSTNPILDTNGQPIEEEVQITKRGFRIAHVFDISQTYGKPLPTIANKLTNDVEAFEKWKEILMEIAPAPVEFKPLKKCNGYYSSKHKNICVSNNLSQEQTIKTLIHEISHAMLHDADSIPKEQLPDSRTKEVQAESIAYVVCQHLGIDSSEYSFGYIVSWSASKELKELKESLSVIQKTSDVLIQNINYKLQEKQLLHIVEKEKNQCQKKERNFSRSTMKH